ncbi:hypothetical protein TEA_024684 [Camellia sinensis var. sinensis]|uniref:Exocyst complex subunit Exo70 C-terminal domain-containing protein n=1 Tax=Camellia sinensis var. sinensis TaxID=542762 RepID=A0A4S4ES49_CAMSN|nr:hypothetical protein TEA_024684 [Camellia sinensis var. sinensis]
MLYRPPVHYTPCQKGTNLSSNIILVSICIYKETSTNKSSSSSLSLSLDQNCLVRTVKQNSVERERENCGGEMGVPTVGIDVLSDRAAMMRESLLKSQSITDSAVSVLGSFDHRLSALETAMRPTQIRTHAIRKAHENIDKTLKAAEVILDQFDLFRQVEAKILKGPREDLESYLEAIEQLRSSIRFFSNNKSFKSSDGVLNHTNSLLSKAISKLEEEFKQLLSSYSKPVEPERLFECLPSELRPSPESPGNQGNSNGKNSHTEHHNHNLENAVYTLPTLILPRILPLLHNLAQQMVKAGHQQQLLKIYRSPLLSSPLGIRKRKSSKKRPGSRNSFFDCRREEQLHGIPGRTFLNGSIEVASLFGAKINLPLTNRAGDGRRDWIETRVEGWVYDQPDPILPEAAPQLKARGKARIILWWGRKDTRSSVLEESLLKLGVEKLSKDDVQKMQWEVLEAKIGNWIHFMRIAVKLVFAGERKVCNHMFEGIDSLRDQCFAEVTASSVAVLLSFGEAIAKSKRSPEKLFVLLDMYEIMRELHSEIETLFKGKACSEIRESALSLMKQLAQTAQETFGDFEEAVEKDATKTAVLDGTVHPLTSYVINYVKFLFDYQSTLKQLFQEFENGGETNSQLASVTMRIMQALQTNLDGKSKQYKDPALNNLFLMNNIHYMVRSVRRSEAKDLLGDDWVQRHRRIVQQHANQYKRIAWAKILQCLSVPGLNSSGGSGNSVGGDGGNSSGASRTIVKDRLKTFNIQFEELHQRQSQWTVPDTELRESLKLAVAEVLLPAYRSFIKRFGLLVENGKNPQKYIRYTAEDLDRMLGEFFEGMTLNEPKRLLVENGKNPQKYIRYTAEDLDRMLEGKGLQRSSEVKPSKLFSIAYSLKYSISNGEPIKDEHREKVCKEGSEVKPSTLFSDRLLPHILNIYGSSATARDFEIYAPDATFEDPLMRANGIKQIKSAFYSLPKILIDNKQYYKFLGKGIDMISLIKLYVEDGKIIRHEDWWNKKPLWNRETVKLPLVGRIIEMTRRGSMLATHAMMRFGKDPTT